MNVSPVIEVVAALVVAPTGRTLLVRKRGTDAFMNPGGKPERGETHVAALTRELHEEIGVQVAADRLVGLATIETVAANEPGHRLVAHCFGLRVATEDHVIAAEIVESRWVDPRDTGGLHVAPLAAEHLLRRVGSF